MAFTSTLLPLAAVSHGHYAASSADTSDSGGDTSVSGRSSRPGLRSVTLCRRHRHQPCLGFSLRGGREHGTGFFVSAVEKGSEAYLQGLMVGDQIIRVNGLPVEDATHREVLNLIQSQNSVTFKVRSVGMIPVKDSYSDSLTWRLVEPEPGGVPEPPDLSTGVGFPNVHLYINVAPKAKLGCGICKGPEWKPGIFVQFTKENSLARNAGLRPGDQIIQCNNVVFTPDTPFTEAVSVLRSTGVLDLVIQKGAGVDLFPGESSGYNSSASSVAGDQSPENWPHKRLSIVKEESVIDSESRLNCSDLNRVGGGERYKDSDRIVVPSSQHHVKPQTSDGACTVIRVGPDMETYRDNELNSCTKLAEICMVSQQLETKTTTVLVEVHQSEDEETVHNQSDSSLCQLTNSSSVSSFSSSGANSLCSAISQELQRRSEKRAKEVNCEVKSKVELHKCGMDKEKVEQHQQLMEEFRRAHKKMFAQSLNDDNKTDTAHPCPLASQSKEERESFRLKRQQKEELHAANMSQERVLVAVKERDLRFERDKQDMTEAERELTRLVRRQQSSIPPPPPLPSGGSAFNSSPMAVNNFTPLDSNLPPLPPFPPDCPTPDYDKQSISSDPSQKNNNVKVQTTVTHSVNGNSKNGSADFVEMQSLESFKLTNPSVLKPKPPPIYFKPNMNGSNTVSSASSKVSSDSKPNITIREYPKNTDVKNPERFQFLSHNGSQHATAIKTDEPLAMRLQDELNHTLSKANLRQDPTLDERTVPNRMTGKNTVTISINAMPNPHKNQENFNNQPGKQAPFYLHKNGNSYSNNNNINSSRDVPRKISTTVISQTYTNGNGVKSEDFTGKNCVSFNLSQQNNKDKTESRVVTVVQPNGILKNGLGGNIAQVQIHASQAQKSPSKSIKFAGITTADVQEPKK
uniref:PDZ domain-containing protein n=2 Tax=Graphocephala atropunctata TaxID=36148 RepID=A0A1B6LG89_9HEMI